MRRAVFPRHGNKIQVIPQPFHTTSFPLHRRSPTTNWSPVPPPQVRGPPRAGAAMHRPSASLPSYPPSNANANASSISLVSSALPRRAIVHAYNIVAGGVEVQFLIRQMSKFSPDRLPSLTFPFHSVEDTSRPNEYEMSLTFKSGGIEQSVGGKKVAMTLIDPSMLKFHILCVTFSFPFKWFGSSPHNISIFPKPSLPEDSLYCVRVWMEAGPNSVQHRIFSNDDLWVARDPPFHTITHIARTQVASTAPIRSDTYWSQTYRGFVGRAPCDFIPSLTLLSALDRVYSVSLDYESGGVKRRIFDNIKVRLHCRLEDVQFII